MNNRVRHFLRCRLSDQHQAQLPGKNGVRQIHPNANTWMQNVNQDILAQAQIACN